MKLLAGPTVNKLDDTRPTLTATQLANLSACPHLVTLERLVRAGSVKKPHQHSPVTDRLIALGNEHERTYLEHLRTTASSIEELDATLPPAVAVARTLDAMKRGVHVIYQGALQGDAWFGRTDFLVRIDRPSRFGEHAYEVTDTKLSLETKGRALLQLCLYSQLLSEAQGVMPEQMHIILGDSSRETFSTRNYLAYFRRISADIQESLSSSKQTTYPVPIEHCDVCAWQRSCEQQRRADDDLSLVARLTSRQRELLHAAEVDTVQALGALPSTTPITDIKATSLTRIREQARIQWEGRVAQRVLYELLDETTPERGLLLLPEPSPGDLFVDLEGDPLAMAGGIEYLIGVTEAGPDRGRFTAFWGTDRAQEKRAFEAFMEFVKERRAQYPDLHLYHYAPYEPAAFKRLAARHNTCESELDELLRKKVFVDLFRAVQQGVRVSVESYSIKRLEPLYGYVRKADLKDAGSCLVAMATWFDRRVRGEVEPRLKEVIAAYNEDDCASTLALRDWLEERRAELEAKRGVLPRPFDGEGASEDRAKREAEVVALERALTKSLSEDAHDPTHADHAQWLLAQLLDWHHREEKSGWWEYYRQSDLSEEERIEDPTALGGLVYEREVGPEKRSTLHLYRFPAQEHGVDPSKTVLDPATGKAPGTIHAVDNREHTLTLKRSNDSDAPRPRTLIVNNVVKADAQQESLMRLGRWVAKHGMTSQLPEYRTERALLCGTPPVFPDGVLADDFTERGKQLALAIAGSVLPVQGPPGSGKTYLAARMIVALIKAGKRVGILANSHKVVGKLLYEACEAAANEGLSLRCVQKPKNFKIDKPVHGFVTNANGNEAVFDAVGGEVDIVAGVSWLWAREEMRNSVDVLFVDEAGQMALANVLASAQAANGMVLLGDPQQLDQPLKGVHPPGAEASALGHVLQDSSTLSDVRGIFLAETWRMHPDVCGYISEVFYEERLRPRAHLSQQRIHAPGPFDGTGLRLIEVEHTGNTNASIEEAQRIGKLVNELLASRPTWTNSQGETHPLTAKDIVIITPYNAQVATIREHVPGETPVGTVDKFQGQEAPIAIYSLATSSPEDAPRGMEFLYSKNRLNVAISRARCVAMIVGSPALFRVSCKAPREMELANAFCRFAELASRVD